MPQYYLQWFYWHCPSIKIKYIKWGWHVLQACNGIQGPKPSGWNWWIDLDLVLTGFVLINVPCEQALYVLAQDDEYMIVLVSTYELIFSIVTLLHFITYLSICANTAPSHQRRVQLSNVSTYRFSNPNMVSVLTIPPILKKTIVNVWYPNPADPLGVCDTTLQTVTTNRR